MVLLLHGKKERTPESKRDLSEGENSWVTVSVRWCMRMEDSRKIGQAVEDGMEQRCMQRCENGR